MKIEIQPDGIWYHGSDQIFQALRTNSTITQWKELAEAFHISRAVCGMMITV